MKRFNKTMNTMFAIGRGLSVILFSIFGIAYLFEEYAHYDAEAFMLIVILVNVIVVVKYIVNDVVGIIKG